MKRNVYYRYNSETDNYERVYITFKERVMKTLKLLGISLLLTVVILSIIFLYFDAPTERNLFRENRELRTQYNLLNNRLDNCLKVMRNIQNRDDNFYRVMMQMDPLSRGQRLAGLDNESRYRKYKHLNQADLIIDFNRRIDLLERQLYVQSLSFDQLKKEAAVQQDKIDHVPSVLPINVKDYTVASGYGYRRDPVYGGSRFHEGLDFAAPQGTPVYATADGVISGADWRGGYGNCIDIDHGYNYVTRYGHLSKVLVKAGQSVKRGEKIGEVGSTGKSTGPHLHYEVRFKNEAQNPVNYYFMDITSQEYTRMIQLAENAGHVMD